MVRKIRVITDAVHMEANERAIVEDFKVDL